MWVDICMCLSKRVCAAGVSEMRLRRGDTEVQLYMKGRLIGGKGQVETHLEASRRGYICFWELPLPSIGIISLHTNTH